MAVTGSTLVTLNNLSYYDSRLKAWVGDNLEDSLFAMTDSATYTAMDALDQLDDKFLYFLTDTGEIYKSGICFGKETDLSDYMKATEIAQAISTALSSYKDSNETETYVGNAISTALVNYKTGTETDTAISTALGSYKTSAQTESYVTDSLKTYYTKTETDEAIATAVNSLSTFDKKVVDALPPNPATNILYLIKDATAQGEDKYKEYIVIDGTLTCIGSTSTDLSGYYTKTETNTMIQQLATHIGTVDDGTVGCIWLA